MQQTLTSAQMRAVEQAAIASGRVTGLELMERAGRAVADVIAERRLGTSIDTNPTARALVICGPGNNGGDGFVVARLLHIRGWQVDVFLYGDPDTLPPDAKVNHDLWSVLGPVHPLAAFPAFCEPLAPLPFDLLVDAAFGIGLTRPLPQEFRTVFTHLSSGELARTCVAIDIPSGLCADTGTVLRPADDPAGRWPAAEGLACKADLTVTFHTAKPGHLTGDGPRYCGTVIVKDIGL
jgi:hydroxyethylthiazole kinase-like uncharacterized protein yjeF